MRYAFITARWCTEWRHPLRRRGERFKVDFVADCNRFRRYFGFVCTIYWWWKALRAILNGTIVGCSMNWPCFLRTASGVSYQ